MFLVRFIPRYFIIFDVFVTESFSRQIDKKFRVPKEEKVVWGSQSGYWGSEILKEEKRANFFFPSVFLNINQLQNSG